MRSLNREFDCLAEIPLNESKTERKENVRAKQKN